MKKLTLITALVAFFVSMQAVAQQDIKVGAVGGLNLAKISPGGGNGKYFKMRPGIHLGVFGEKEIQENLSVQAGLMVSGKGYAYKNDNNQTKLSFTYLEIPINAVYRFDQLFVGAGPYVAFGLGGKAKTKTPDLGGLIGSEEDFEESGGSSSKWHTTKLKMGSNGDFKGLDLGLNLLAGYQINSKLSVNLGYGLGLVNISGGGGQLKNRVLSLSARYMLKQ